jgi:hypothetical protein
MSRLTMITTSEKATQKSITLPTRSVHHTNFLWAFCATRSSALQPTDTWPNKARAYPYPRSPT